MPRDEPEIAPSMTKLRAARLDRGLSQKALAELTGIPLRSLERLDRGEVDDAPFRWLINLSIALDRPFTELVDKSWGRWKDDINPRRRTPRPEAYEFPETRSGYRRARGR